MQNGLEELELELGGDGANDLSDISDSDDEELVIDSNFAEENIAESVDNPSDSNKSSCSLEEVSSVPSVNESTANSLSVAEEGEEGEDDCCICMSELSSKRGVIDCCNHKFCWDCLKRWKKEKNACPICGLKFHVYMQVEDGLLKKQYHVGSDYNHVAEDDRHYFFGHTICRICGFGDFDELLLICDGCELGYHTFCIDLPGVPKGDFFCSKCKEKRETGTLTKRTYLPQDAGAPLQQVELPAPPPPLNDLSKRNAYKEKKEKERKRLRLKRLRQKQREMQKQKVAKPVIRFTEQIRRDFQQLAKHVKSSSGKVGSLNLRISMKSNSGGVFIVSKKGGSRKKPRTSSNFALSSGDVVGDSWSKKEDDLLLRAVERFGKQNWTQVSDFLARQSSHHSSSSSSSFSISTLRDEFDCRERYVVLIKSQSSSGSSSSSSSSSSSPLLSSVASDVGPVAGYTSMGVSPFFFAPMTTALPSRELKEEVKNLNSRWKSDAMMGKILFSVIPGESPVLQLPNHRG